MVGLYSEGLIPYNTRITSSTERHFMAGIHFTEAAQTYLAELLSKQDTTGVGIRVFITQPGTPYVETCIAYCMPGEEKAEDLLISLAVFTVWVDAVSEPFLEDAVVDYASHRMGCQLTI